ncbi:conserved oligomeric Golgi complex subunit 5 [Harmonia axyridis]|uniref:conserved oligomeric Golgi complex subunit 5 n=1 Tax=Harmonia axyridis TaxID=115357 RepID=UPI001E279283|nr:conserved oligomeric Golgi complex subunit 5 [Harmonia axyridis]
MENEIDLIQQLENDELFCQFLNKDSHSKLYDQIAISDKVKKLGEGIDSITRELQKCVLNKHEDLLKQANHATKLENILNLMNSHVYNLVANAENLKLQINIPYEALNKHTQVLGRLHLASHILRQVSRIQQLSKRLSNTNDPSQKALILQELEQLAADEDLKDIHSVSSELRNIRTQQQKVVQLATGSLNQGIINENSVQTTSALQIFINLGTINKVLDDFISSTLSESIQGITYALETTASGKSKAVQGRNISLSSSQGYKTKMWTELEKAFSDDIYKHCKQVKFLQNSLHNLNLQNKEIDLATKFWTSLGKKIQEQINSAPYSVQQILSEDYPRLLRCYLDISKKMNYEYFSFDRTVLEKCETAYLSTSLTTLLDPTQEMFFSDNSAPSTDDIDKIVRIISSNLSVALIEENLSRKISKNVSKCIKMFAVKTEQQLDTGPDSAQVIGGNANLGQQKNVQLANRLNYFQRQIQRILSNMNDSLSNSRIELLYDALKDIDILSGAIMQPLVVSINSTVETILVTIHLEADWTKLQTFNKHVSCSPYMRELGQFINRVFNTYLAQFENKEVLLLKCGEIAVRCIELFVRHTTLLRPNSPITEGGRQRLKADYIYLESVLRTLCPTLTELGKPYRLLKAMTSLITLDPTEIINSYTEGSVVPASTILLLLFSHAGAELASPHQNTEWSLQKLSAWLDEHQSENDRLDLIAGALQRYEALTRQKNSVNYDPMYPVMSQFFEKVIKN